MSRHRASAPRNLFRDFTGVPAGSAPPPGGRKAVRILELEFLLFLFARLFLLDDLLFLDRFLQFSEGLLALLLALLSFLFLGFDVLPGLLPAAPGKEGEQAKQHQDRETVSKEAVGT